MFWRRKTKTPESCVMWLGETEHSADPTPVTVLTIERPCGHGTDSFPVCTTHLRTFQDTDDIATNATACTTCGVVSKLAVISHVPAR